MKKTPYDVVSMYPVGIRQDKFIVKIRVESVKDESKTEEFYESSDSLVNATRIILTFKPKKGWKVVSYNIEEIEQLAFDF